MYSFFCTPVIFMLLRLVISRTANDVMKKIAQDVEFGFWEKYDETHSVIRFATSWATTMEDTQKLIQILEKNK